MFSDEQRRIFDYARSRDAGGQPVGKTRGDPLALQRALAEATGATLFKALADHAKLWPPQAPDGVELPPLPEAEQAQRQIEGYRAQGFLAAAAVKAFGLVPYSEETGEGVNEDEALDTLYGFLDFLESKKKPPASSPTCSSPSPESAPCSPPPAPAA